MPRPATEQIPLTVQVPLHNVADLQLRRNAAAVAKLEEHLGAQGRQVQRRLA